jgi:hypothetical protein
MSLIDLRTQTCLIKLYCHNAFRNLYWAFAFCTVRDENGLRLHAKQVPYH